MVNRTIKQYAIIVGAHLLLVALITVYGMLTGPSFSVTYFFLDAVGYSAFIASGLFLILTKTPQKEEENIATSLGSFGLAANLIYGMMFIFAKIGTFYYFLREFPFIFALSYVLFLVFFIWHIKLNEYVFRDKYANLILSVKQWGSFALLWILLFATIYDQFDVWSNWLRSFQGQIAAPYNSMAPPLSIFAVLFILVVNSIYLNRFLSARITTRSVDPLPLTHPIAPYQKSTVPKLPIDASKVSEPQ